MNDRSGPDREEVSQPSLARPTEELVHRIRCSYVPGYAPTPKISIPFAGQRRST